MGRERQCPALNSCRGHLRYAPFLVKKERQRLVVQLNGEVSAVNVVVEFLGGEYYVLSCCKCSGGAMLSVVPAGLAWHETTQHQSRIGMCHSIIGCNIHC